MESALQKPARSIVYWIATGLIAFILVSGGIVEVIRQPAVVAGFARLGYPVHFVVLLGVWKLLGGLALLAPRLPASKSGPTPGASSTSQALPSSASSPEAPSTLPRR